MIKTIPIPTTVSRMGCAPGADCCADCASHKMPATSPLAGTHTNRIASARNMALRRHLGTTQCDPDGNCYTDGVLTSAPLTTGAGCPPGVASCNPGGLPNTTLYLLAGLAAVALLEATSRRR